MATLAAYGYDADALQSDIRLTSLFVFDGILNSLKL